MKVIPERKTETIALKGLVMIYNHTKFEPESSKGCPAMAIQSLETKSILGVKNHVFPKFLENGKSEQGQSGIKKSAFIGLSNAPKLARLGQTVLEKNSKNLIFGISDQFFFTFGPLGPEPEKNFGIFCVHEIPRTFVHTSAYTPIRDRLSLRRRTV